jgi:hypothetical protein
MVQPSSSVTSACPPRKELVVYVCVGAPEVAPPVVVSSIAELSSGADSAPSEPHPTATSDRQTNSAQIGALHLGLPSLGPASSHRSPSPSIPGLGLPSTSAPSLVATRTRPPAPPCPPPDQSTTRRRCASQGGPRTPRSALLGRSRETKDVQELSASRRRESLKPLAEHGLHLIEGHGRTLVRQTDTHSALRGSSSSRSVVAWSVTGCERPRSGWWPSSTMALGDVSHPSATDLFDRTTEGRCKRGHLFERQSDVPVSVHKEKIHLLHLVRQSRRARNEMPMHVRVSGLATE